MKKATYHARVERFTRIEYIIEVFKGEFGKPIAEIVEGDTKRTLTTNGIIVISGVTTGKLVTMWIATVAQATSLYRTCHNCDKCPKEVMDRVCKNCEYARRQPQ